MDVGLVCDECRTFNAMGAPACVRCSASLSLGGDDAIASNAVAGTAGAALAVAAPSVAAMAVAAPSVAAPSAAAMAVAAPAVRPAGGTPRETRPCATCGNLVAVTNRFCGGCGASMRDPGGPASAQTPGGRTAGNAPLRPSADGTSKKTLFFGAMQATHAKLVVIKGDGLDGVSFTLAGADHLAGRGDVPILFEDDPFLSPVHANFVYRGGKLAVRDEDSVNGVYLRIRGAVTLGFGDRVLIGEQVLEVQSTDDGRDPSADGTFFYASPRPAARFRLLQRLRGGGTGLAYHAASEVVSIGREGNEINFPDDPFISGHHARVSYDRDVLTVADLGSKNGTFMRIRSETMLEHGDYVFMGQQLLRVEIV